MEDVTSATDKIAGPLPSASRATTIAISLCLLVVGAYQLTRAARFAVHDGGSDLDRQWLVQRYVWMRIDPYKIAFDSLAARYGYMAPRGTVHLRELKIFDMPRNAPNPQTIAGLGPPTATYPPSSIALMMPIGLVRRFVARDLWVVLNILLLPLLAWELSKLTGAHGSLGYSLVAGIVAAWPASWISVERGQFSLLVLWCILVAVRLQSKLPIGAGLLYCLALVKPSVTIPFLFVPLFDRRIKTLATIAITQAALLGFAGWWLHTSPFALVREWLSVAAYFRQGMYTVQEIINGLHLDGSWLDLALQLGIVAAAGILSAWLPFEKRLPLLALASCIWTYHSNYDFVALLIPAVLLAKRPINLPWAAQCALLVIIGFGLTGPVYDGVTPIDRAIRWGARLSLACMLLGAIFTARGSERRAQADSSHEGLCR
jgi:Glycosyltransferase family 87